MSSTPAAPSAEPTPPRDDATPEAGGAVTADASHTPPLAEPAPDAPADLAPEVAQDTQPAVGAASVPSPAATGARLAELFPALFTGPAKPLKLRIQADIQARAPGEFSKQALSAFLRRHTGATSYLVAVSKGTQRFDLEGQPAGELSEEHRQVALEELTRRRANQQARRAEEAAQRQAAQREQRQAERREQRQADRAVQAERQQQQAAREQAQAERCQRAQFLRDFDTTRLTAANFCALKGIRPEQLDGLLAQARAEAAEDAARPRPAARPEAARGRGEARSGDRGDRRGGERRAGGPGPRREGAPTGNGPRPPRREPTSR